MKVIRRGVPPSERTYRVTCRKCESVLEFAEHEARVTHDQRDGKMLRVECPVCHSQVFGYPGNEV